MADDYSIGLCVDFTGGGNTRHGDCSGSGLVAYVDSKLAFVIGVREKAPFDCEPEIFIVPTDNLVPMNEGKWNALVAEYDAIEYIASVYTSRSEDINVVVGAELQPILRLVWGKYLSKFRSTAHADALLLSLGMHLIGIAYKLDSYYADDPPSTVADSMLTTLHKFDTKVVH